MISPSSHEGVDLRDDLSRFQVVAKIPYGNLSDKRTTQRMASDEDWYQLAASQKIVQACGRSVRSDKDHAVTYIIDALFPYFRKRSGHLFPKYFTDAIRTGKVNL